MYVIKNGHSFSAFFLTAFIASLAMIGTAGAQPQQLSLTRIVQIESGPVQGVVQDGVDEFLGIPYAAPPVGNLRWRPPQPALKWQRVRSTVAFGNTCAQTNTLGVFAARSASEDCLFLNVFAPSDAANRHLPVMVWIHGGGLFDGASNPYDGSKLARQGNVIVVTINYRLNVFGFLAAPSLDHEGHPFGDYGLMDQQYAFRWVQRNIAGFGGDPSNITIFGESAGGRSVLAHLASPTAKGLFQRAIVESGTLKPQVELSDAEAMGTAFAKAVGCPQASADCLRGLSVHQIQSRAGKFNSVAPVIVDGTIMTQQEASAFKSGQFNHVPVINGANKDGARFFVALGELTSGTSPTAADYADAMRSGVGIMKGFGKDTQAVLARYPLDDYNSASAGLSAALTDSSFICTPRRADRYLSKFVPVYAYEFADRTAPSYAAPVSFPYGAYHTGELQYLFPLYRGGQGAAHAFTHAQARLSDTMVAYWTAFARSGDPNGPGTPDWPKYDNKDPVFQKLILPQPIQESGATYNHVHQCNFWDGLQKQ